MTSRALIGTYYSVDQPMDWTLPKHVRYAVYQKERCPKTGRIHFQWYAEFKKPVRYSVMKKAFPGIHVESRKGDRDEARAYCMKEESRIEGPWEYGKWESGGQGSRFKLKEALDVLRQSGRSTAINQYPEEFIRYHRGLEYAYQHTKSTKLDIPEIELKSWQKDLIERLQGPVQHRTIYWIWSHESGTGKTTFQHYIYNLFGAEQFLILGPELRDNIYAYDGQKVLWYDIPRQQPLDAKLTSMLEKLSDTGPILSTKYESMMKIVKSHIVVTTNRPPPHDKLPQRLVDYHVGEKYPENNGENFFDHLY